MTFASIGVLGAGSWGTALAVHAAQRAPVTLWARDAEKAAALERARVNEAYLPGVVLPPGLRLTADLGVVAACDLVLVVVPSHGFRDVVRAFLSRTPAQGGERVLVSATKGVETDSLSRMSEVLAQEGARAGRAVRPAVLSGPTFAAELARGVATAAVVAAAEGRLARAVGEALSTEILRLYSSTDLPGVELGGAAKNVIAIGAGIIEGLGLGHNTAAALITRGLHEITRLGVAFGGSPRTLSGLAGLGDLVLTCTGGLSRNRRAGMELAAGASLAALRGGDGEMVAEGIRNAEAIARLAASKGVEMPIIEQMNAVLYHGRSPAEALRHLMTRDLKAEADL
jgi:glycerol-3-phosphate dehydrogenase (NAD(P)+)